MKKLISIMTLLTIFFTIFNFSFFSKRAFADFSSDTINSTIDETMQYHYGTNYYDIYLWIPKNTTPGNLKSLVSIKANLSEVPFVYSTELKKALAAENSGIMYVVMKRKSDTDPKVNVYNNTMNGFYTRRDYAGNDLYPDATLGADTGGDISYYPDGKDAGDIFNDMLKGIADASGYTEIADKTPLITMGHSAASPFGYISGNWNPKRIIAQVQMKNGMSAPRGNMVKGVVPGIPHLQYAAQYTEHVLGYDRDRSYKDATWQLQNVRGKTSDSAEYLVSHIIEWGAGHYDWSDNATKMLKDYIIAEIDARVPDNFDPTSNDSSKQLKDLTGTGYIATPFDKGQTENAYNKNIGWLSNGQVETKTMDAATKKTGFWYFNEDFEKEVNNFTKYAIPSNPEVEGKTYTNKEPYMLLKNPSTSDNEIKPYTTFNGGMARYGGLIFNNYVNGKYGDLTVDSYYMTKIPTTSTKSYDGQDNSCNYPIGQKAEVVPLMAPYEVVSSQLTGDSDSSQNVGSVTKTTLRYHNNRVYYEAVFDQYGFIKSPELGKTYLGDENYSVTSQFKATAFQMNVPKVIGQTPQTLTMAPIDDYNINTKTENIPVTITSSDSNLSNLNSDLMVEYGPAKAVRGANGWEIQILKDQIPEKAKLPIAVNVVASNLGEKDSINAASTSQVFLITNKDKPVSQVTVDGKIVSSGDLNTTLAYLQSDAITNKTSATLSINKTCELGSGYQIKSNGSLTVTSENPYGVTVTRNSNGVEGAMFNAENGDITIGESSGNKLNIVDNKYTSGTDGDSKWCTFSTQPGHDITLNDSAIVTSNSYPTANKAMAYIANNSTFTLSGATINYTAGPLFAGDNGNNVTLDFDSKIPSIKKITALSTINYKNIPSNHKIIDGGDGSYYVSAIDPDFGLRIGKITTAYSSFDNAVAAVNANSLDATLIINKDCNARIAIAPKGGILTIISNNPHGATITRDANGVAAQMIKASSADMIIGGVGSTQITIVDNKYPKGAGYANWTTFVIGSNHSLTLNYNVNVNSNSYSSQDQKGLISIGQNATLNLNGAKLKFIDDGYLVSCTSADKDYPKTINFNNKISSLKSIYSSGTYILNNLPENCRIENINGYYTLK